MIKRLEAVDVDGILSIDRLAEFSDGWSEKAWISSFKEDNFYVFGKYDNDKLIGYISSHVMIDSCDIELVLIDKDYRRKSFATMLINHLENFVKLKGVREVFIEVREGNFSARRLYDNNGYKEISVRKKYYFDGENAIILKKEI